MKKNNDVSPRSRGGNKKQDKTKQQHGTARENDFFKLISKFTENMNVSIMECDKVPEVVLDFEKKDKNKLN